MTTTSAEWPPRATSTAVGAERARDVAVAADAGGDVADRRPERRILRPAACRCADRRTRATPARGRFGRSASYPRADSPTAPLSSVSVPVATSEPTASTTNASQQPIASQGWRVLQRPIAVTGLMPATLCRRHGGRGSSCARVRHAKRPEACEQESRAAPLNLFRASPGKGTPSRWRFHPPLPLAFRLGLAAFPVRPSDATSTYSRSVLAAQREPMGRVTVRQDPRGAEVRKERKLFPPHARLLQCEHGRQRAVP